MFNTIFAFRVSFFNFCVQTYQLFVTVMPPRMSFQLMFSLLHGMGKIVDDVHVSRLNARPISPLPAFCFLLVLGEQVVYYSRASVVIYTVLENYYCVVLSPTADSG